MDKGLVRGYVIRTNAAVLVLFSTIIFLTGLGIGYGIGRTAGWTHGERYKLAEIRASLKEMAEEPGRVFKIRGLDAHFRASKMRGNFRYEIAGTGADVPLTTGGER